MVLGEGLENYERIICSEVGEGWDATYASEEGRLAEK
jgi:hypothetical protein